MYLVVFFLFCFSFFNYIEGSDNCTGTSSLITFDNLPTNAYISSILNGYFGLNWLNVYSIYAYAEPSGSGYRTALSSGSYDIFNGYGNPMIISAPVPSVFNISSFIAAAAWRDNLQLSINGQRNGTTLYQENITLQVTNSSLVILNWDDIDTITFTTSGGTVDPMFAGVNHSTEFAMDNLCADVSSFYTATTTSGQGGGENGGNGVDIPIGALFGSDTGLTFGVAELSTSAIGGIIDGVIAVLIILGFLLWYVITSNCCKHAPNCNQCRGVVC